jgi:methionyl aminopeptidase
LAEREIRGGGAVPAFKGIQGLPRDHLCVGQRAGGATVFRRPKTVLSEGDIISIDLGAKMSGFFGGLCVTVGVGRIEPQAADLLRVTEESLWKAIDAVRPGARVSDIGYAVQSHVEKAGFSVVREFVGHGIGSELHGRAADSELRGPGPRGRGLSEGMVLAIEPMVNLGGAGVKVLRDGWTAITSDRQPLGPFRAHGCRDVGRRGSTLAARTEAGEGTEQ